MYILYVCVMYVYTFKGSVRLRERSVGSFHDFREVFETSA